MNGSFPSVHDAQSANDTSAAAATDQPEIRTPIGLMGIAAVVALLLLIAVPTHAMSVTEWAWSTLAVIGIAALYCMERMIQPPVRD